jgi:hypothetical protein
LDFVYDVFGKINKKIIFSGKNDLFIISERERLSRRSFSCSLNKYQREDDKEPFKIRLEVT